MLCSLLVCPKGGCYCQVQFSHALVGTYNHAIPETTAGMLLAIHAYLQPKAWQQWFLPVPQI